MNNVTPVILRFTGPCLRPYSWPQPFQVFRRSLHIRPKTTSNCRPATCLSSPFLRNHKLTRCSPLTRGFTTTHPQFIYASRPLFKHGAQKVKQSNVENGVSFSENDLTQDELSHEVFGAVCPPSRVANRFLRVLQARRLDGTLDLEYDKDLSDMMRRYPYAMDSALHWLRENFPLDEDAAILVRLDREEDGREVDSPSELTETAQNVGIYEKQRPSQEEEYYGPQSGRYHARLSEQEDDVFGQSQLEKIRAKNEAEAAEEEQRLESQIQQIREREESKAKERSEAVAIKPEQGVEASDGQIFREPNEFEKWILRAKNRASSNLTLDSPEAQKLTVRDRLLSSFLFVLLGCAACYLFSQYWIAPRQSERLWPNTSMSFLTIGGIIATNVAVFLLWRFPPALRLLNRYFCVSPLYPRAFSMLGNIFSHHGTRHLLMNTFALIVFGPALHEDVGRGTFLSIYLASGLVGSFASLSYYVLRGIFYTTSMGASGCIWGITTAYFVIHSDQRFVLFFISNDWKDTFALKGWVFLGVLIGLDAIVGMRQKHVDVWAHWFGMITGIVSSAAWKWNRRQESVDGQLHLKQPGYVSVLKEPHDDGDRSR